MHVNVDELPKHIDPVAERKRKLLLIGLVIGVILCVGIGLALLLLQTPPPIEIDTTIPEIPHYNTDFLYEVGVIPAAYNQHVIKITHGGGESIGDINQSLWISIYPPDSTPYQRRTSVIHTSKYFDFVEGDILYIYLGKDQKFYASKELPDYDNFIDFPNGAWGIHIDDARYQTGISTFKFEIEYSKTHLVNGKKDVRIADIITSVEPFDTIFIKGDQVYREQLEITDKPIRLYSLDNSIIDAGGHGCPITLTNASFTEISGFSIINSGNKEPYEAGILLKYSDHITIRNNNIYNQNGIYLIGSENNDIRYNQIYSNDISGLVFAQSSDGNTAKENIFQYNTMGIYIKDTSNANFIVKNTGSGNTRFGILIDEKLKNTYEYNDFGSDKMSYDKVIEILQTSRSADKTNWDDWFSTCGSHESQFSPACQGK
jgi:parallel beta-helix repeat protein